MDIAVRSLVDIASQSNVPSHHGGGRGSFKAKVSLPKIKDTQVVLFIITATHNNTHVVAVLDDDKKKLLRHECAGMHGFKSNRKSSPHAAHIIGISIAKLVRDAGGAFVNVEIRGIGAGREALVKAIDIEGLKVIKIAYCLKVAHNGPRPRKRRRL